MIPMRLWHPLTAMLGGVITVVLIQLVVPADQAAALAHDLAAATGFPVDTRTDIPGPWGICLLGLGAAWVVWVCIETRSLLVQAGLFTAAVVLLLTGAWIARLGGGDFPTVPVLLALVVAFILGQFAVGFNGDPAHQALYSLLDGTLGHDQLQEVLSRPLPPEHADCGCLVAVIEPAGHDLEFLPTLQAGLKTDGAWVRMADDGRLQVVFGLFTEAEEFPMAAAWAALARAADAMAARPHPWRLASRSGSVGRIVRLAGQPGVFLRGPVPHSLARWLDECQPARDDSQLQWLAEVPAGVSVPGWAADDAAAVPVRLRPAAGA